MGENPNQLFQLSFNGPLKIDFQGSRLTSDGGLILVRELDERLGFGEVIQQHLTDSRRGKNTQFPLADLLQQSVYSRRVEHARCYWLLLAKSCRTRCLFGAMLRRIEALPLPAG